MAGEQVEWMRPRAAGMGWRVLNGDDIDGQGQNIYRLDDQAAQGRWRWRENWVVRGELPVRWLATIRAPEAGARLRNGIVLHWDGKQDVS